MDTGLNSLKTVSKKAVHKVCEFIENKIADALIKSNDDKIVKQKTCSRNSYSIRRKRLNIKQINASIIIKNGIL